MIKISPSILASDFANLQTEIEAIQKAGAHLVHIDVMDGHFVPNISIGIPVVAALRKRTSLPLDVHLMISDPLAYAEDFAKAGSDIITFHLESESDTAQTIAKIKSLGVKVGVAIKPMTEAEAIFPYLKEIDMALVMTVEPGFGGQSFLSNICPKIQKISDYAKANHIQLDIQVDGGITQANAGLVHEHGANVLVAGSAIFGAPDYRAAIDGIIAACKGS